MLNRRGFLRLWFVSTALFSLKEVWGQATQDESPVLALDRLRSPWDSLLFTFGTDAKPGIAVRLPDGELTIVSRVCPHQGCYANLIKDPAEVLHDTTYEPETPVVVCPCHGSVFDLANGGKVLFGPAPRPLDRFKFKIEGKNIVVTDLEK